MIAPNSFHNIHGSKALVEYTRLFFHNDALSF
jgi:hypothetical protein